MKLEASYRGRYKRLKPQLGCGNIVLTILFEINHLEYNLNISLLSKNNNKKSHTPSGCSISIASLRQAT